MQILRNRVGVKASPGIEKRVYRITSTAGGVVVIETHCETLLFELAKEIDATASLVAIVGTSTLYPGTVTVSYTVGAGKTLEALVISTNGYEDTDTLAAGGTLDDEGELV
jgi:hypothetical protein